MGHTANTHARVASSCTLKVAIHAHVPVRVLGHVKPVGGHTTM
ncbi:hypothetical protein F383_33252 [Gossypium arboreum]|uniref:Uncharacterized protein n=1 Tax=Gossypium arboreum TaxID=29729 RepID=A0A0B0N7M2_GOSAR|nr:hypothetical protein F383_33252 [Gossypium arboreum]